MKPLRDPMRALVSYQYYQKRATDVADWHRAGIHFIGDSGAFSAHTLGKVITVAEYERWLDQVSGCLDWIAGLDVIGDPSSTWDNFLRMRADGYPVVPTVHAGTNVRELDRYVDQGCDFIGLGGMAARNDSGAILRWLVSMFRYQRDHHPQVRFHGWGITRSEYVSNLPFWSIDSSGFGGIYRFARLKVFDSQTGKTKTYKLDGGGAHAAAGRVLRGRLGVTPAEIMTSGAYNRPIMHGISAHHAQDMELFYMQRHHVTPPPSLAHLGMGTRVHLADTDSGCYHNLARLMPGRLTLMETT